MKSYYPSECCDTREKYDAVTGSLGASTGQRCHTVKVRSGQRYALFFEYMFRSLVALEGNIGIVAQARISVLVIRRCATHHIAALLPTV
jgi:hypothetical protein